MTDPVANEATEIIKLAFPKNFQLGGASLTEQDTETATTKSERLCQLIQTGLGSHSKALQIVAALKQGFNLELNRLAVYLQDKLEDDPQFAVRVRSLVQEIHASEPAQTNLAVEVQEPSTPVQNSLAENTSRRFLICGLGSLGQYCVFNLKQFASSETEIHVTAIDKQHPKEWEVDHLLELLAGELLIGDCRNDEILVKAGIKQCRAILIVTDNESVNVETAIAARRLHPRIWIVLRSSRHNLNRLLKQYLGNFVALEPTELPAPAFALAGLQQEIIGFFNVENYRFQVVEQIVQPRDYRFDGCSAIASHKHIYRLLSYSPAQLTEVPERAFYQWQIDTNIKVGDKVVYVEVVDSNTQKIPVINTSGSVERDKLLQRFEQSLHTITSKGWRENLTELKGWFQAQRIRQVITLGVVFALFLWGTGTVLLKTTLSLSWRKATSIAFILLLGGYGDIFGGLDADMIPGRMTEIPGWVQVLCGFISLASIASVLGILGLITDALLSTRFEFLRKRPRIPKQDHVIVIGFGRIGQRVATILQELKQPVVAMTDRVENATLLPEIPLMIGNLSTELSKVNLATAKSIVVVTDDQMLNLEIVLMAREVVREVNRRIGVVIRTSSQHFQNNLTQLLPDIKALTAHELAAEAFTGAAFGENILGLFRLNHQTILVTEYHVKDHDTLAGKLLSQVAYGYGVVPIFHQRASQSHSDDPSELLLPRDDRQLQVGDRLIVLASINELRRIEHGDLTPPDRWRLEAQRPLNPNFIYDSGNDLARISGCGLDKSRAFMNNLPGTIDLLLYDYQAHHLKQELSRQLRVTLIRLGSHCSENI